MPVSKIDELKQLIGEGRMVELSEMEVYSDRLVDQPYFGVNTRIDGHTLYFEDLGIPLHDDMITEINNDYFGLTGRNKDGVLVRYRALFRRNTDE